MDGVGGNSYSIVLLDIANVGETWPALVATLRVNKLTSLVAGGADLLIVKLDHWKKGIEEVGHILHATRRDSTRAPLGKGLVKIVDPGEKPAGRTPPGVDKAYCVEYSVVKDTRPIKDLESIPVVVHVVNALLPRFYCFSSEFLGWNDPSVYLFALHLQTTSKPQMDIRGLLAGGADTVDVTSPWQ